MTNKIILGNSKEVLPTLDDKSIDAIITDPPYELSFMGKKWDSTGIAYDIDMWKECLRILKPGSHLLSFGGTRTYHRMACTIEDAGFEIRDSIHWVYGSGFPKSLSVDKAIDRHFNAEITAPSTIEAKQWSGFGTALKPAHEPIVLARKPLEEKTIAENVLKWGVGGLNIDACRISTAIPEDEKHRNSAWFHHEESRTFHGDKYKDLSAITPPTGRFPSNLIHDGSEAVLAEFAKAGIKIDRNSKNGVKSSGIGFSKAPQKGSIHPGFNGTSGSAARFFQSCPFTEEDIPAFLYYAKASKNERGEGNNHPTVKSLSLMKYLCRLICPPGGLILDPFAGSGTTCLAAKLEGFHYIGIEKEMEYVEIANKRLLDNTQQNMITKKNHKTPIVMHKGISLDTFI